MTNANELVRLHLSNNRYLAAELAYELETDGIDFRTVDADRADSAKSIRDALTHTLNRLTECATVNKYAKDLVSDIVGLAVDSVDAKDVIDAVRLVLAK